MRPRAAVLLALTLAGSPARAFELLSTPEAPLEIDARALRYRLALPDRPDLERAARAAFDRYANVDGAAAHAEFLGRGGSTERDGTSAVGLAGEALGAGEVARTVHWYDAERRVFEIDVLLGTAFPYGEGASAYDAESVLVHEVGHFFGLAHSCGAATRSCFGLSPDERWRLEVVMAPTLGLGTVRRELSGDDRAGIRSLWPGPRRWIPEVEVERGCSEVRLVSTPTRAVELFGRRVEDGARVALPGGELPAIDGEWDLLVVDRESGGYRALVPAPPRLVACDPEPPLPEGCSGLGGGGLLAVLALLAARRRGARAAVVGLVVLGLAPAADAYRCSRVRAGSGPSIVWPIRDVHVSLDQGLTADLPAADVERLVRGSLAAWSEVPCSDFRFVYDGVRPGLSAGFDPDGDNENAIVFLRDRWPYDRSIIAVTTNAFDPKSGRIFDSDIEVNDANFRLVDATSACGRGQMDLANTITHEAGHVLGLDHPPAEPAFEGTTMYASAPSCETQKRSLADDDVDGLCFIYPAGNPTQQCSPPEAPSFLVVGADDGFGCQASSGRGAPAVVLLVVGVAWLRRRR